MPAAKEYCVTIKFTKCVGRAITKSVILKAEQEPSGGDTEQLLLDRAIEKINKFHYGQNIITHSKIVSFEIYPMAVIVDKYASL